jgi:YbbR domain-containing protein
VALRTRGQVAEGYNLTSVRLDQSSITVEGPVSVIQALRSIDTEEFDLTGLNSNQTRAVRLQLPTGITSLRESVNVTFNIEPSIATWTLAVAPAAENTPDGLQAVFQTNAVSVVIRGELPTLNRLAGGAVRAIVDLTDMEEGIHLVKPEIRLPAEITLVSVDPEEIIVGLQP